MPVVRPTASFIANGKPLGVDEPFDQPCHYQKQARSRGSPVRPPRQPYQYLSAAAETGPHQPIAQIEAAPTRQKDYAQLDETMGNHKIDKTEGHAMGLQQAKDAAQVVLFEDEHPEGHQSCCDSAGEGEEHHLDVVGEDHAGGGLSARWARSASTFRPVPPARSSCERPRHPPPPAPRPGTGPRKRRPRRGSGRAGRRQLSTAAERGILWESPCDKTRQGAPAPGLIAYRSPAWARPTSWFR